MENLLKKTCALLLLATTTLFSFLTLADPLEHQALLDYLNAQPGMTATPDELQYQPGYLRIDITYQQPIDHQNPLAGQFTQRIR
jgi:hypothetical protein